MKTFTDTIPRYTVFITIDEMWKNFMESFTDFSKDMPADEATNIYVNVHSAFFPVPKPTLIIKLFTDGHTPTLLGEGMDLFDTPVTVYRQVRIISRKNDLESVGIALIDHDYINF
jgi:hypothetical protein